MTFIKEVMNSYKKIGVAIEKDIFCSNNCEYATFKEFEKGEKFIGKTIGKCPWCKATGSLLKYYTQ